jgi:hypothetical protein
MPVDAALIPRLRGEVLDDLDADYLSLMRMCSFADELVGAENHAMVRELVLETVVDLVDDPVAKVVDAPMAYTFSDSEELRRHFEARWPRGDRNSLPGELIFWVVYRDDDTLGNSAPAPSSGFEQP